MDFAWRTTLAPILMSFSRSVVSVQIRTDFGLCVIDMRTGDLVAWLWLQGVVRELYDVVVLPGVRRPSALGFKTDEIRRTITIGK